MHLHPVLDQFAHRLKRRRLVDRLDLGAVVAEPAGHLADEMERHQPLRLHPEERVAVAVRHRLPGDLDHVAEAAGDDQPEAGELVLEHRVGRDRRAVEEHRHVLRRPVERRERLLHAVEQADARIGRRRRRLHRRDPAGFVVDRDHVGEGSAGVDGDPEPHARPLLRIHIEDIVFTLCTWAAKRNKPRRTAPAAARTGNAPVEKARKADFRRGNASFLTRNVL